MARLVVLGGAESGVGAAVLAKVKGFDVFLSDCGAIKEEYAQMLRKWEIPFEQGSHTESLILNATEVVKSPGIPCTAPLVVKLQQAGIPVLSEIEFASRYDSAKKICITGSNGKTTTTSLVYHLLNEAGYNVGLGGNIGMSYALQVATQQHDWYVLEISSFQLDNCYTFRPDIAILCNITPDHLDRYDHQMINYVKSKFRIAQCMEKEQSFIYDSDDPETISYLPQAGIKAHLLEFTQAKEGLSEGAYLENGDIVLKLDGSTRTITASDMTLSGKHNVYNTMAACLAASLAGLSTEHIKEHLHTFQAIEHRLEPIRTLDGVLYINDSKATNVDSAWYALECQKRPVVWIVGGKDKGNDYSPLFPFVKQKVKAIVCLGADNAKLHANFDSLVPQGCITDATSAEQAAQKARSYAQEGDVVLLSPCCASFDLFKSYEDRGRQFKQAVNNLE